MIDIIADDHQESVRGVGSFYDGRRVMASNGLEGLIVLGMGRGTSLAEVVKT
jgi:hypothetical protein